MTCERYDRSIEAYVDGECQIDEAAAIREHLRDCHVCRRRAERLSDFQEKLRRTLSAEPAPPDLWRNIADRLDQVQTPSPVAPPQATWSGVRGLAAVAAIVVAVVASALAFWPQTLSEQSVVRETVQDFVTFQLSGRPFDSTATDRTAVRTWFAGKIQFELPPMKASAAGFTLVGSRLCWLLDRRLGAFAYRRGDQLMMLYAMDGDEIQVSGGRLDPALGMVAVRRRVGGYNSLVWRRENVVLSLVSDAPEEEMTAFATGVIGKDNGLAVRADGSASQFAAGGNENLAKPPRKKALRESIESWLPAVGTTVAAAR